MSAIEQEQTMCVDDEPQINIPRIYNYMPEVAKEVYRAETFRKDKPDRTGHRQNHIVCFGCADFTVRSCDLYDRTGITDCPKCTGNILRQLREYSADEKAFMLCTYITSCINDTECNIDLNAIADEVDCIPIDAETPHVYVLCRLVIDALCKYDPADTVSNQQRYESLTSLMEICRER